MRVNPKKNIKVVNRTNYFDPTKTKVVNEFRNPNTSTFKSSKQLGYETRLYYEFLGTTAVNGTTLFYTLTYNDKNLPKYYGKNCFDYEDLRYLTNGGFPKYLLRHYGTKLKYFVGAELGDGKGTRGFHNNPHYHILFFLTPADNSTVPYKKIDPVEFRSLIRYYWQGFDQDYERHSFKYAKKGIVKEGDYAGVVQDYRAISYVSKYVCKDITLKEHEDNIRYAIGKKLHKTIPDDPHTKELFFDNYINSIYNIPTNCTTDDDKREYMFSPYQLFDQLVSYAYPDTLTKSEMADILIDELKLDDQYTDFVNDLILDLVDEKINYYRNRYCNKCRVSNGIGDYALQFIDNYLDPQLEVATDQGIKVRSIGQYYYRKIYCDLFKDQEGQPIYVLNQKGIDYKCSKLQKQIDTLTKDTWTNFSTLTSEKIYNDMYYSDVNTSCSLTYSEIQNFINNNTEEDIQNIIKNYATYKLVYENRFFEVKDSGFPTLDPISDYRYFITPTYGKVPYDPYALRTFINYPSEGYMAYSSHPTFLQYHRLYSLFDLISDYYFIQEDDKKERESEERARIRRFHKSIEFNNFIMTI